MLPSALLPAASKMLVNRRIEASVLKVIRSRKLQHILRSHKHEAFQKVKHKRDLIEQPYLDKVRSRKRQQ